jgi:hypothetical protein
MLGTSRRNRSSPDKHASCGIPSSPDWWECCMLYNELVVAELLIVQLLLPAQTLTRLSLTPFAELHLTRSSVRPVLGQPPLSSTVYTSLSDLSNTPLTQSSLSLQVDSSILRSRHPLLFFLGGRLTVFDNKPCIPTAPKAPISCMCTPTKIRHRLSRHYGSPTIIARYTP